MTPKTTVTLTTTTFTTSPTTVTPEPTITLPTPTRTSTPTATRPITTATSTITAAAISQTTTTPTSLLQLHPHTGFLKHSEYVYTEIFVMHLVILVLICCLVLSTAMCRSFTSAVTRLGLNLKQVRFLSQLLIT